MNDNDLRQLIAAADAALAPKANEAPSIGRLANRWHQKQRKRRIALATLTPIAVAGVVCFWLGDNAGNSVEERVPVAATTIDALDPVAERLPSDPQTVQHELATLDRKAEMLLAATRRLRQARSDETVASSPFAPPNWSIAETLHEQRDRAAMVTVLNADRMRATGSQPAAAVEDYRGVIERFPDCHWSAVARSRLADAEEMN